MTKRIFIFTIFSILISCSEKQFSFENYSNYPVKFAKKNFVYPNNEFEIFLPLNWESKVDDYEDNDEIILGIDAVSKPDNENFIHAISVQKMKPFSSKKDLKSEYDYLIQKIKQKDSFIIIDSGKTDFLQVKLVVDPSSHHGRRGRKRWRGKNQIQPRASHHA